MNNQGKILSFDVDSVLLDTEEIIFEYIYENYQIKITSKDLTHWTYYIENFPSVLQYFGNPEIYEKVGPIVEMISVMEEVIKMYGAEQIQLITSSHKDIKQSKEDAINKFFGHLTDWEKIDVIHVGLGNFNNNDDSHHKHTFSENTILIDDAIHNIKDHLNYNHNNKGILVDFGYGWNQGFENKRATRATSPKMILETIKRLSKNIKGI
jgi:hypothetical protein